MAARVKATDLTWLFETERLKSLLGDRWIHGLLGSLVHHSSSTSYSKITLSLLTNFMHVLEFLHGSPLLRMFLVIRTGRRPKPLSHFVHDKTCGLHSDGLCCFLPICCMIDSTTGNIYLLLVGLLLRRVIKPLSHINLSI